MQGGAVTVDSGGNGEETGSEWSPCKVVTAAAHGVGRPVPGYNDGSESGVERASSLVQGGAFATFIPGNVRAITPELPLHSIPTQACAVM